MSAALFGNLALWAAGIAVAVVVGFWVLSFLYRRASKEVAFVRTGFGGEKVVINSGALVIPIIHEVTPVGLSGARISITCAKEQAAITSDRMRVDISAEFFLRVTPSAPAVAVAAATLGTRTLQSETLAEYFAGHLTAAIRGATAESSLEEIQGDQTKFGATIQQYASAALEQGGVSLTAVALRNLDQSDLEFFNSSNRFDAEGLTALIGTIEERRKMRNDIEQASLVEIRRRNLDAERAILDLEQESTAARLEQERSIEASRAAQQAAIEKDKSAHNIEAEAARIAAVQETSRQRIEQEQSTNEAEIRASEQVEKARLASEAVLDESRVARERALRILEIDRAQEVAAREVAKDVAVHGEQVKLYEAQAQADQSRAAAVAAAEEASGAKDIAVSRNRAQVSEVEASSQANVAAQLAQAQQIRAAAAAEAERIMNEADNILSEDARAGRLKAKLIDKLETIIRESMKPLEKIDGFKVVHVGGGGGGGASGSGPLDEVINSAMRYRVQAPLIDEVLKEIGLEGGKLTSSADVVRAARDMQALAKETSAKSDKSK